jgi:hypothetical protein
MAGLLLSIGRNISAKHNLLYNEFNNKKKLENSYNQKSDVYCISKFSRLNEKDENFSIGEDISLFCVGTVMFDNLIGHEAILKIKKELILKKIDDVVHSLDGHFILILINHISGQLNIVTDHAGMMHIYTYKNEKNFYFSTSSAIFSKNFDVTLDFDAIVQFLRCDSICDYDTIYNEIKLLAPGTIYTYQMNDQINENKHTYWMSPTKIEKNMTIQEATDIWSNTLQDAVKTIPKNKVVCDLTGGYDTRSILAAMLPYVNKEGPDFSTFVFGPQSSKEVKVAKEICTQLKINNTHLTLPSTWHEDFPTYLENALSITDAEENLCNYAPILYANEYKNKYYSYAVNGMGGCFAKSFNWLQEITPSQRPAKIYRFIKLRSLHYEYDHTVHSSFIQSRICNIPSLLKDKYINIISDMDLSTSYNTLQLDNIDLRQRERRWGGRTISSSNQIIKIFAPLYLKKCLEVSMVIPSIYKKNGRLVKKVISKMNPELAHQKMLSGAPCEELTFQNFYRFTPVLLLYLKKMGKVFSQQVLKRTAFVDSSASYQKNEWYEFFFLHNDQSDIMHIENWVSRKLYDEIVFRQFVEKAINPGFRYYPQLEKMISLELRMRTDNISEVNC